MTRVRAQSAKANSVILVDDESEVREAYRQMLELEGFEVVASPDAESALSFVSQQWPGVLVSDIRMPRMDGLELFEKIREIDPELPVILITAHGEISMAVNAMRNGAYDFIEKPADPEALIKTVGKALDKRQLVLENRLLRGLLDTGEGLESRLIGLSEGMQGVRNTVAMLSDAEADVLIVGETGTGKELVARCLHDFGPRRQNRFVAVNCGALPETIIESELFGHERGAFTGARSRRIGKIEYASGGTLFLDEIESMPVLMQAKLLRVLQERTLERLGSNESVEVDIRVIAAAKTDLEEAQRKGTFRSDLFYRLNVASILIPSLGQRRDDIPVLFRHFATLASLRYRKPEPALPGTAFAELMARDWPGNVRELKNLAERHILGLPLEPMSDMPLNDSADAHALKDQLENFEKTVIGEALRKHHGRIGRTADYLHLPRKTLYLRMRKHGFRREDFA